MDGVEVIDLCSESQTKNYELHEGKESTKQESRDKMKTNTIARKESKNRPGEGKPTTENEGNETTMMCLENLKHSVRELDLAMCVSSSSNGSKMRSLWTNQMKS